MSDILPTLIAVGVVLPVVGFIAVLLAYVHRHKQPDKARLNVFRGLLWFVVIVLLADLTTGAVLAVRSKLLFPPTIWFVTVTPLFIVVILCALEIRQSQKRLARR